MDHPTLQILPCEGNIPIYFFGLMCNIQSIYDFHWLILLQVMKKCHKYLSKKKLVPKDNYDFHWFILLQVMKKCHKYLSKKKLVPKDEKEFKETLYDLWFKLYSSTKGMG